MILSCLSHAITRDCNEVIRRTVQSGAMMAIIDAYDRKVDRNHFILLLSAALGVHTGLGRFDTLKQVLEGTATTEDFPKDAKEFLLDGMDRMAQHCEGKRREVGDIAHLVAQMATSQDTIN